jgi:hypothetical protein
MRTTAFLLAAFAAAVSAQTPEGFEPAVENTIAVSYGTLTVTPGLDIPSNSRFFICLAPLFHVLTSSQRLKPRQPSPPHLGV